MLMGENRRVRIRVTVKKRASRYQVDKRLGELYRLEQTTGETFTEFKRRMKNSQNDKYNALAQSCVDITFPKEANQEEEEEKEAKQSSKLGKPARGKPGKEDAKTIRLAQRN